MESKDLVLVTILDRIPENQISEVVHDFLSIHNQMESRHLVTILRSIPENQRSEVVIEVLNESFLV